MQRELDLEALYAEARRVNEAAGGRFTERHSSLQGVIAAVRGYQLEQTADNLAEVTRRINAMPAAKADKYAIALHALQRDVVAEEQALSRRSLEAGGDHVGPDWLGSFDRLLHGLADCSARERRAYRESDTVRALVQQRDHGEAVAIMGVLLTGSLGYAKPGSRADDFYGTFVLDQTDRQLPEGAAMNCWEFLMYSAKLAGRLSLESILVYYRQEAGMGSERSYAEMGWHEDLPALDEQHEPRVGDLVFVRQISAFRRLPGAVLHVVMYAGGGFALSHDDGGGNLAELVSLPAKWPLHQNLLQFITPEWLS